MPTMKVLIAGGGIGGNTLAFWLAKAGYDVTVLERFESLRATGLQIDLRGPGIKVMRRMGLEKEFRELAVLEDGMEVVDSKNRQKAFFPVNRGEGLQNFTTDFEMMRGDLCRLLYKHSKDKAKFLFGTTIKSYKDTGDSVKVLFSDGKEDTFDLVVGADGQSSALRRMMFGEDTPETYVRLGVYIGYYTVPRPKQPEDNFYFSAYFAPGPRWAFTRRSDDNLMQVYLAAKHDSPGAEKMKLVKRGDVEAEKDCLAEIYKGAGWKTEQLVKYMYASEDFYMERLAVVKLPTWSKGRLVLVGDAAYCPSATTGMGTTSTVTGAYILANEIVKACGVGGANKNPNSKNLPVALKAYEDKYRPFMAQVQRGLSTGDTIWDKFPRSSWGIALLNLFLQVVSFLNLNVLGRFILREDVKDWSLDDYKLIE